MINGNLDFSVKEIKKDNLYITWGTPFVFLVLLVLSFGLMLPWLGFAFDEWHFIYYFTRGSQGLAEIFNYDGHPQALWSYIKSFEILGYNPLYWHLYSLFWRWLAVVSFWLCLKKIWPDSHRQNFFAGALFAIHPVFTLQVFPITFFEIWIGYTLLFLSFHFTILAIHRPEKQQLFTIIGIILAIGHAFTREYSWFVELMRPVIIWLALSPKNLPRKKIIFQTIRIWLPFCVIFASSLIWRGLFYAPTRKFFQVQGDLFANPMKTVFVWIMDLIPDVSIVLITSWYETFKAEYFYLLRPFNAVLFILVILMVSVGSVYVRKVDSLSQSSKQWATQAILLGLPSIMFGILPFYIASYSIHLTEPPYNSRLAIGMLPGAALISAAILEKIISRQNLRILMMVVVLGMSINWHIRYTNDYRKIWVYQSDFLKQLTWRVPGMEKNTAIFVWQPSLPDIDNADASFVLSGDFALSMAINSIYKPTPTENRLSYWYYFISDEPVNMMQDTPLPAEHAIAYFDGNSSDSLFFYYDPENNQCLHLVSAEDQYYKRYPDIIKDISPYVTTDRISATESQNVTLRDEIFHTNEPTWCFVYQKAELARQYQQWDDIPGLWKEAMDNGLRSEFGTEYIPFVVGFAHLSEWQNARDITIEANQLSKAMNSILCPLWSDIERSTLASQERNKAIEQVENELQCTNQ